MYLYFGTCRQVICEMFIVWISVLKILVEKNDISGYIWHRSCIQTIKCSSLVKLFFLQGKVCVLYPCVSKSLARCLSFRAFRRPCRKNYISAYIGHISRSFKRENTLLLTKGLFIKVSMARCSREIIFSSRKCVIAMRRQVACKMFIEGNIPKTCQKIIYPLIFDTNCSFKR